MRSLGSELSKHCSISTDTSGKGWATGLIDEYKARAVPRKVRSWQIWTEVLEQANHIGKVHHIESVVQTMLGDQAAR
jgi:hypothetical protein